MTSFLEYVLLGLGAGVAYVLLSQGVILVYRASGTVNFAQGAYAMFGAYAFYELRQHMGYLPAFVISVAVTGLLGLITYLLVIGRLRDAAPLTRAIATLGIVAILQAIATMRYQSESIELPISLPHEPVHLGPVIVPAVEFWMCGIAIVLTAAMAFLSRRTRIGLASTAVSESEIAASTLGWSPDRISALSWFLGSALAAVAGILIAPLSGLNVTILVLLIVPALATALLGSFSSFGLALAGGLLLGVLQSVMQNYVSTPGWPTAVPFIVIALVLVVRGRALPLRSHIIERLPALGDGRLRPSYLVGSAVILGILIYTVFPTGWVVAFGISIVYAIVLLSATILTGYAGQLSLAQFGIGGIAALITARLYAAHWPFLLALVAGIAAACVSGLILGLPSLRARGVSLAVITLGLGSALQAVVFNNQTYMGGAFGTDVGQPSLFGIQFDSIVHPQNYAIVGLVFLLLSAVIVCNVRRGVAGRRLVAVRTNERAASSLGISVFTSKLYAFVVASGLAGLGCALYAFQGQTVTYADFEPFHSINVVAIAVVGGIGYALGAPLGAVLASGGVGTIITNAIFGSNADQWLVLIGGVALILILLQNPNGSANQVVKDLGRLVRRLPPLPKVPLPKVLRRKPAQWAADDMDALVQPVRPLGLTVRGATVRFGGVVALQDVDLDIRPGEVLGLIGPNGAGKTTFIDAVSGFASLNSGEVVLGGTRIEKWAAHRRARAGLTRSFQSLELFDDLTVYENLQAAGDKHRLLAYVTDLIWPRKAPLTPAAIAAIREFALETDLSKRAGELSYGRRRLLAIARAVATEPSVLLLDEPAAGLGSAESAELGRLIRNLAKERGIAVLLVEHDVSVVMGICDRVAVLEFGRKIADDAPEEISQNPEVIRAYLGDHVGLHDDQSQAARSTT